MLALIPSTAYSLVAGGLAGVQQMRSPVSNVNMALDRPIRVAVIGGGPSGACAAEIFAKVSRGLTRTVGLFNKLQTQIPRRVSNYNFPPEPPPSRITMLAAVLTSSAALLLPPPGRPVAAPDRPASVTALRVRMGLFDWLPGNQKEATPAGSVQAKHILFLAEPSAEKKADQLIARIVGGEISFSEAARAFSCCPSRDLNGDLGTLQPVESAALVVPQLAALASWGRLPKVLAAQGCQAVVRVRPGHKRRSRGVSAPRHLLEPRRSRLAATRRRAAVPGQGHAGVRRDALLGRAQRAGQGVLAVGGASALGRGAWRGRRAAIRGRRSSSGRPASAAGT